MLVFLLVSTVASLVVSLILGIRLLRLAARTRELPEFAIGLAFIIAGVIAYSLMLIGNPSSGQLTLEQAMPIFSCGYALISLGVVCTYVFIWSVFRRDSAWGRGLMVIGSAGALITAFPMFEYRTVGIAQESFYWFGQLVRIGSGLWGAIEAIRWWSRMKRRVRLGLAEAIVANRFALWGAANLSTLAIFVSTSLITGAEGVVMTPARIALISSLTLSTTISQWLAFLPPAAYRKRFESKSGSAPSVS